MPVALSAIIQCIDDILQDYVQEDDKLGTAQHVVPAALLRNFTCPIDFQVKAIDHYNLPAQICEGNRDAADRYLTHVESHSYAAIDQLLRAVPGDQKGVCLENLVCNSTRRNVQAKHSAMFYLYIATLVLRSPTIVKDMPSSEEYIKQGLQSHTNVTIKKYDSVWKSRVTQFAYLSPFVIKSLAVALAKKSVTIYLSAQEFLPGSTLAGPVGVTPKDSRRLASFQLDYLAVLSSNVAVVFESSHTTGCAFNIKDAKPDEISDINVQIKSWRRDILS